MGRSPCCSKDSVNRGAWSAYEDSLLSNYIEAHGEGGWRSLPKKAGLKRCGKSCRLRWLNYLRPNIKRGNISADEEELIIRMHGLLGNRWSLIAGRVPGRTDNEIKNYWNTYLSKKLAFKGLHQKTRKPVLDSHHHNEAEAAKVMAPRSMKPVNSKWAARSGSMPLQILDDHDQQINCDSPQQSDLNYDSSVLDDQCNFLPSFPAQINNDPSSYTNPSDFNCSNTLMAGPDDNLIDVEVISSRCLDEVIISCPPEAPNLTSVDQLQFDSVSHFNTTCDFSQSSDMPETGNDLSFYSTTVPDLHEQTVIPHVKIDCPLQESADQINTNISSNTFLPAMAPSDDNGEINVHADQISKFQEVLNFFEVEVAEKEICRNRWEPDSGQGHAQHLKADATCVSHASMDQLQWDGHEPLQIQGELGGSCSLDYGLIDGSMWETSIWH